MYVLTVTIATTGVAQRIIPKSAVIDNSNTAFQNLLAQNNGAATMTLGDAQVTTTNGIILSPGASPPGASLTAILALSYASDLKDFWVIGTAGDRLNIMVFP